METREKHPETIRNALRAGNPTYQFREGDVVRVGINNRRTVLEVLDNGLCYLTENEAGTTCVYPWYSLRPLEKGTSSFTNLPNGKLHYMNVTVEILLMKHLLAGVDFYPEYQRNYVWEEKDRISLLDSIFTGVDIGRIIMRERSDEEYLQDGLMYEIIDGKQRLLTLLAYYENRFPYHGVFYNELSDKDRRQFLDADAALAIVHNLDMAGAIRIFLMTNKSGKTINDVVIKAAEKKLRDMQSNSANT